MKIDNLIKKLRKDNLEVVNGEFDFKGCWMCNGTALVDLKDGIVVDTKGSYKDVINQITHNKSHIYTTNGNKSILNKNNKLEF